MGGICFISGVVAESSRDGALVVCVRVESKVCVWGGAELNVLGVFNKCRID